MSYKKQFINRFYNYKSFIQNILMQTQNNTQNIFYLETQLQNHIETALQLNKSQTPEQTPFVHKYQAIQILKILLTHHHSYKFIVYTILGEIYNDVQQLSDSNKSYQNALKEFQNIPPGDVWKFYNYLIVIYNMLGLSYINRDDNEQGLGCLAQSVKIYETFKTISVQDVYHNRSFEPKGRKFKYLYEGGIDHQQLQDSYTLTLFYLAQAYTKLNFKTKAAQYCGMTLQRQYSNNKYQLKQFINNLTGLAQYYQGNKHFSQAQYLLLLALKVIPEGKKKKLRATVYISLGDLIGDMLQFSCQRINQNNLNDEDNKIVSKKLITFNEFEQSFPELLLPSEIQGCKTLFRQANTQFKKALETFVLDGYVTQHIDILFSQSRLYKSLTILQKSFERKASMLDKRREMLEPLIKQLNPKAYPATWQKILVQVAQIVNDLFNLKVGLLGVKGFPSDAKINGSCELGKKSIYYYGQILKALLEDKQVTKNQQYYRSIINSKINIAKAHSKLMSSDRKQRVQYMKQSWKLYQHIIEYIKTQVPSELQSEFDKQVQLTKDMIAMMPNKIDKINYGQMNYLD